MVYFHFQGVWGVERGGEGRGEVIEGWGLGAGGALGEDRWVWE